MTATNFHAYLLFLSETTRRKYLVYTLDPKKFDEKKQQRFQIGNKRCFMPSVTLHNHLSPVPAARLYYDQSRLNNELGNLIFQSFPPDTKAFLYFFTSPIKSRLAGELRLRVAPSDNFASFESGSDLLLSNGQPWSHPLSGLPKHYIPLYKKLKEDRLVPDDLDAVLSTFSQRFSRYHRRTQRLYTLNDAFIVDFSSVEVSLSATTEQGMEVIRLAGPFFEYRNGIHYLRPYTGAYINHHSSILLG
jgi:hypothetical protein